VTNLTRGRNGKKAELECLSDPDKQATASVDDIVVVAEFRDTIYPGLASTGKVSRGEDKPWHTVINGENYHALRALTWTHRGKIDAIYIDPPYNSGARDWKYNNDYVEADDLYRHSKWLAMIERRLLVAKELLNPADSVLIASIDEKEYLRLGLLLEQTFVGAKIEMVSSVINPKGTGRTGDFARTNEFLFFVRLGNSTVQGMPDDAAVGAEIGWETMRRRNLASVRGRKGRGACGPNQFFPIGPDRVHG
jgi:adenine-specific DNA-methyltransferase